MTLCTAKKSTLFSVSELGTVHPLVASLLLSPRCHTEIVQGTPEWHAFRKQHLMSTDAAKCFRRGDAYRKFIETKKHGEPEHVPWAQLCHGHTHEPFAAEIYAHHTGHPLASVGCVVHPDYPWLAASPDRIDTVTGELIEIKCAYSLKVPTVTFQKAHYMQMQIAMACTGLHRCHYLQLSSSPRTLQNVFKYCGYDHVAFSRVVTFDREYTDCIIRTMQRAAWTLRLPRPLPGEADPDPEPPSAQYDYAARTLLVTDPFEVQCARETIADTPSPSPANHATADDVPPADYLSKPLPPLPGSVAHTQPFDSLPQPLPALGNSPSDTALPPLQAPSPDNGQARIDHEWHPGHPRPPDFTTIGRLGVLSSLCASLNSGSGQSPGRQDPSGQSKRAADDKRRGRRYKRIRPKTQG